MIEYYKWYKTCAICKKRFGTDKPNAKMCYHCSLRMQGVEPQFKEKEDGQK